MDTTKDAVSIYSLYTKRFVFPGGSLRKGEGGLRRDSKSVFFSDTYDEPTYLTFRIEFDFDCNEDYAYATEIGSQQFNEMPHPLFNIIFDDIRGGGEKNNTKPDKEIADKIPSLINSNGRDDKTTNYGNIYSAYNYLKYSLGEDRRATMLLQLKAGLYDIQNSYPFYIKSIDGLSDLMKIEPAKGVRIPEDRNTITLKCEEGIDMKITQILQLYRKIVWDDVYQRWVLPDMMRFFKMNIYISEMRLFHDTQHATSSTIDETSSLANSGNYSIPYTNSDFTLVSNAINEMMPTICIECRQCTFDLENTMTHLGSLSSSIKDTQSPTPEIKIHVGNILETHSYKLNRYTEYQEGLNNNKTTTDYYKYSDKLLSEKPYYSDTEGVEDNKTPSELDISSTLNRLGYDAKNQGYTKEVAGVIPGVIPNTYSRGIVSTLIDNAFGYLSGTIGTALQYGKDALMSIPIGNGYTVGDVWSSITTGDVGYLFNMIRDAIEQNDAVYDYEFTNGPGAASGPMVRIILQNIVDSAATSGGVSPFVQTAMQIVNNPSVATDATNKIADIYNAYQKLVTNEAIDDKDNGYKNPGLVQPNYTSTSNDIAPSDPIDPSNKGISNEVIDDTDKGYSNPGLINPGYVSTANTTPLMNNIDPNNKGLSNEVIDDTDNGYSVISLVQPPYVSTANEHPLIDPFDPNNRGLTNEAISDSDNGYADPGLVQPEYQSTASITPVIDNNDPSNKGLSNEVIDDTDSGYSDQGMVQPNYTSTAIDNPVIDNTNQNNKGLSNEVIEDVDSGYSNPGMIQPAYTSSANNGTVVDNTIKDNKGLSNEVIDDTDKGYSTPGLINEKSHSLATSGRKINWRGITLTTS